MIKELFFFAFRFYPAAESRFYDVFQKKRYVIYVQCYIVEIRICF